MHTRTSICDPHMALLSAMGDFFDKGDVLPLTLILARAGLVPRAIDASTVKEVPRITAAQDDMAMKSKGSMLSRLVTPAQDLPSRASRLAVYTAQ